eukprot:scaffold2594_cov134-Pinguiococcus_pyrenoidosus.AAC.2
MSTFERPSLALMKRDSSGGAASKMASGRRSQVQGARDLRMLSAPRTQDMRNAREGKPLRTNQNKR